MRNVVINKPKGIVKVIQYPYDSEAFGTVYSNAEATTRVGQQETTHSTEELETGLFSPKRCLPYHIHPRLIIRCSKEFVLIFSDNLLNNFVTWVHK